MSTPFEQLREHTATAADATRQLADQAQQAAADAVAAHQATQQQQALSDHAGT